VIRKVPAVYAVRHMPPEASVKGQAQPDCPGL